MMGIWAAEQRRNLKNAKKLMKTSNLALHIGSVAIGLEALEAILVERGVLKADELMDRVKQLSAEHYSKDQFIPPSED